MAFWKFTGGAPERFPTLGLTARPGYVYDLGSTPPPPEPRTRPGDVDPGTRWVSDPGPATDFLVSQVSEIAVGSGITQALADVRYIIVQRITTATAASAVRVTSETNATVWWIGSDAAHPPANALPGDVWDHS